MECLTFTIQEVNGICEQFHGRREKQNYHRFHTFDLLTRLSISLDKMDYNTVESFVSFQNHISNEVHSDLHKH